MDILETIDARMQQEDYRITVDELKQLHACAMELSRHAARQATELARLRTALANANTELAKARKGWR